jgi:hypothetical protein
MHVHDEVRLNIIKELNRNEGELVQQQLTLTGKK